MLLTQPLISRRPSGLRKTTLPFYSLANSTESLYLVYIHAQVGGRAVLGRREVYSTPWLTERHGYDPTYIAIDPTRITDETVINAEAIPEIQYI